MGQNLSSEQFDELCAPILKKAVRPPAAFKPCKLTQRRLGAVCELAFLLDGTIAGNAAFFSQETQSTAIRGVFFVSADGKVTTDLELSTVEHTTNVERDETQAPTLALDSETGLLCLAVRGQDDDDQLQVEEIPETAFAEQFLPPLLTTEEQEKQREQQQQQQQGAAGKTASEVALAAALSALGVTEPDQRGGGAKQRGGHDTHQQQHDQSGTAAASAAPGASYVSPARSAMSHLSQGRSPGSSLAQAAPGKKTLFQRLGGFEIPFEEDELKRIFLEWSEGKEFVDRRVFEEAFCDYEADCGLEVSRSDLDRVWKRISLDEHEQKLSFREFQLFLLSRSKQ